MRSRAASIEGANERASWTQSRVALWSTSTRRLVEWDIVRGSQPPYNAHALPVSSNASSQALDQLVPERVADSAEAHPLLAVRASCDNCAQRSRGPQPVVGR